MREIEKLLAMQKAFEEVKKRQRANSGIVEKYLPRLREVRKSVGDEAIINSAKSSLEKNGIEVLEAKNADEVLKHIIEIIGDEKLIVKSKSNTLREVNLIQGLEEKGIEVVETDIGDRIIQIMNESPSHPTGPAAHLSVEMISKTLSSYYGRRFSNEREIVRAVREEIVEKVNKARIGISGANAIPAEGAIVVLHNEGNISEVFSRVDHWIVVAGVEKLYPSLEDAIISAKVQSFYATGNLLPSFIEIISGASKTADIEKRLIKGVSNPKEITVILLDRSETLNSEFREFLYCIGCGNCVVNCPARAVSDYAGGRFAILNAIVKGDRESLKYCLSCRKCKKNCPLEIDIPKMVSMLREGNEVYNFIRSHIYWLVRKVEVEIMKRRLGV